MQKATVAKAGIGTAVALAISLGMVTPAHADVQPSATDAVAVGSDTVQYVSDFLDDGDTNLNAGYNTVVKNRVFSFDATGDASGRASYGNGSTTALATTIVLRQGAKPTTRPNGSGAGLTALLADSTHKIDFVRSSRLPSAAEIADARTTAFGGLHVYRIATDGLQIAVAHTLTDAGTGPITAVDLGNIYKTGGYTTWGQIPGYNGATPSAVIIPIIPQAGSGTRNDFVADIKAQTTAAGAPVDLAATGVLRSDVVVSEEHDPTAITNAARPADAIAPFSTGRDKLIDTGYFGTTPAPNTIDLLPSYVLARNLYLISRQSDVISTVPFQAGAATNLVNSLFGTSTSWYGKASNASLYTSAGVVRAFLDKGINPTS